jgi:predicted Zn-dependent protease
MVTKAKSSATTSSASHKGTENPLSGKLAAALDLFYGKKLKEAEAALNALLPEARESGNFGMIRTIGTTLAAIEAKAAKPESGKDEPTLAAAVLLNRKEAEAALEILDKALKGDAANPRLNYLKAAALVQLGKAELGAEALGKAISADPGIQVLFRMERDFDGVRYGSAFADFERD